MSSDLTATIARLAVAWRRAGVSEGDLILLHSDIRRTLRTIGRHSPRDGVTAILQSFLEAVGATGTLLLPLFNFDFTQGVPFDIRATRSQMGALTESGRTHPGAVRTGHAIYSFAAIGAEAKRFKGLDNFTSYGSDSPFQMLRDMNGKIAVLDRADRNSMTFYHHVEEILEVPYRHHKVFRGPYRDMQGHESIRAYDIFVRAENVVTHVDPMGEILWSAGLYTGSRPWVDAGLRVVDANALFKATADIINADRALGTLYVEGEAS